MRTFENSVCQRRAFKCERGKDDIGVSNKVLGSEIDEFGRREVARLRRI